MAEVRVGVPAHVGVTDHVLVLTHVRKAADGVYPHVARKRAPAPAHCGTAVVTISGRRIHVTHPRQGNARLG